MDPSRAERFMREAIELARDGARRGAGGPFGAVVVQVDTVVGRAYNEVLAANDPTAHAEILAIRAACARLGRIRLDDCVLVASCEPCPMCVGAALWARIGEVYFAATRGDAAAVGFDDAKFHDDLSGAGRPSSLRRIQILREEAAAVIADWGARPGRKIY